MRLGPLWLALLIMLSTGCAKAPVQTGQASWYGPGFRGKPTASGKRFRPRKRTAAHKTLPFGTVVKVTRTDSGQSVRVVINDRGPYAGGRVIDLSRRAARKIDMIQDGVAPVEIRVVGCRRRYAACNRGS